MPTSTYNHPLLGEVVFKTKSPRWVRGDPIEFTAGFIPAEHIADVVVPQLSKVKGANKGRFPFHARAHGQLLKAFAEVEKRGLLSIITEFGGGFNPRLRKPTNGSLSKLPSNHAFGLAIDLNPNDGSKGDSTQPLRTIFEDHGFLWGGMFTSRDPMHYEVVKFHEEEVMDVHMLASLRSGREATTDLASVSSFIAEQRAHFPNGLRRMEVELDAGGAVRVLLEGAGLGDLALPTSRFERLAVPLTYEEIVQLVAANNRCSYTDVTTELVTALIWKESSFNPTLKNSSSTATGLMQITKPAVEDVNKNTPTGVHYSHKDMTDPAKNIQCGTYYLGLRIKRAGGKLAEGLDGYGTGPGYSTNIIECAACLKGDPDDPRDCLKAIHS